VVEDQPSFIFKHKFLEYIKLMKKTCVQVLRCVKNEQCFKVVAFMKNKLRKKARVQVLRYVQNEQCFKVVPFMKNKLKNC
jgi:hypothetical protein